MVDVGEEAGRLNVVVCVRVRDVAGDGDVYMTSEEVGGPPACGMGWGSGWGKGILAAVVS